MSDFHIVIIFNDYYTQIIAFFDQTDAEQKQKQTCCKPTNEVDGLNSSLLSLSVILRENENEICLLDSENDITFEFAFIHSE